MLLASSECTHVVDTRHLFNHLSLAISIFLSPPPISTLHMRMSLIAKVGCDAWWLAFVCTRLQPAPERVRQACCLLCFDHLEGR